MKKLLIFGASGDTGRYLIDYLIKQDLSHEYEIIASGNRKPELFKETNISYFQVDIANENEFEKLPKDIDIVISLAGYMPAKMEGYVPQKYFQINTIGTLNILEFCRKNNVEKFIFATTYGDIIGNVANDIVLKHDSPINFSYKTDHTAYVISKIAACQLIENYHQMYGIKTVIFRLPTVYMWAESPYYYVDGKKRKLGYRLLIDKAIAGEKIEVYGDPTRVKDMVYVKDFCQMIHLAFNETISNAVYNVGTGIGTSLLDIIKGMVEVFGEEKKSEIVINTDMPDTPQHIMDITNAKEELGYVPQYTYIEMLKDMKNEMKKYVAEEK